MVLATLLLVCAVPQADDAAKIVAASEQQTLSAKITDDTLNRETTAAAALPAAPEPKAKPDADPAALRSAQPFEPVRPARPRPGETRRQRVMWYGLMAVGHGAASFDAWSTRLAISSGHAQEANPFLKPFANSNAIYAATQVSPAFMDFVGKRMMISQNPWVRKLWWVPQVAGTSVSFVAGAHNIGVAH